MDWAVPNSEILLYPKGISAPYQSARSDRELYHPITLTTIQLLYQLSRRSITLSRLQAASRWWSLALYIANYHVESTYLHDHNDERDEFQRELRP